jgi:hypothetical protein
MHRQIKFCVIVLTAAFLAGPVVHAAVTGEDAKRLNTDLTPFGAEKAGNKEGTIPAWTGGYTTPLPDFRNGGRRGDPFAGEKPIATITAANMEVYASQLTEGTRALLKKYPQTFRVDVYSTRRTAAAPQWVYDNTFKNATTARLDGEVVKAAYGGIPFPIPKNAREIVANNELHCRAEAWQTDHRGYLGTSEGKRVLSVDSIGNFQMPYYFKDGADKFTGDEWMLRLMNNGPPVRAGEALLGRRNEDPDKENAWVYLTGQRRVRKLATPCCDTPSAATSGVMSIDETDVLSGRTDRFDWKIVGKQEMLIPYNCNGMHVPTKDSDLVLANHLNPDLVRWELHRVWIIEANLKPGQRHLAPRSRYYVDEDTWVAVLGDRYDAKGQLWKTLWSHPVVMPDLPATTPQQEFGFNDLISGIWYISGVVNEKQQQYKIMPRYPDSWFTPESLAAEGVR